jgi:glyoxylate reductase
MAIVAVTSSLPGAGLDRLSAMHEGRRHPRGSPLEPAELAEFAAGADALLTLLSDRVDASVFVACPRLKVVANVAVGVNNIDLDTARAAGVWVTNTPDVLTEATADFTMALLLAVTRRLVEGDRVMRAGAFTGWRPDYMMGSGLQRRVLGIVGLGRIGRAVARRALAFGMTVHAYDPTPPGKPDVEVTLFAELDALLPTIDVLTLHTPLTPSTRRLIDSRRLALLPRGAYLVNTSRGEVVDEAALVAALESGQLAGAALDVYEREPDVHPGLPGRDDVVLAPHLGSATRETRAAMADLAIDNVLAVLAGRRPPTPVVEGSSQLTVDS